MKKILIASIIGGFGLILLINGYVNGKQEVVELDNTSKTQIEGQISDVSTTTSTIATTKKKTTKKVVKTTKKVVKKNTKNNTTKWNISFDRNEILAYMKSKVIGYTFTEKGKKYVWNEKDYEAIVNIAKRESGINPNNINKKSGACGIFQSYKCSKALKNYPDYATNWKSQVEFGIMYIRLKYKTPRKAWEYWQQHYSY